MRRRTNRAAWIIATALLSSSSAIAAEPTYERLQETTKRGWLDVGLLLQVVADAQPDRTAAGQNGFSLANARVSLGGELDGGFGYFVQGNLVRSPSLLDGRLSYRYRERHRVDVGLFKAPFSAELLVPASTIDFVDRSRA